MKAPKHERFNLIFNLLLKVSEPYPKEVHLLSEGWSLLTCRTCDQPLPCPVLLAAPVQAYSTLWTLDPVLGDRQGAEVAQGARCGGEQGKGAMLLAVGYKLVMLVQTTFSHSTVQVKSSKTLLKIGDMLNHLIFPTPTLILQPTDAPFFLQ